VNSGWKALAATAAALAAMPAAWAGSAPEPAPAPQGGIRPFFDRRAGRRGSPRSLIEQTWNPSRLDPETPVAVRPSDAPPEPFTPPADPADLLAMTDEMRAYFAERVDPWRTVEARLDQILTALLTPRGLDFTYEATGNTSAAETFRRRRGNCMSFSLLVVAVARAAGCEASFNEVRTWPQWDQVGSLVAEVRHINVVVFDGAARYEIDLQPLVERMVVPGSSRPVSDQRAFAEFYGNLGVVRLARREHEEALRLLRFATEIDPACSTAWTNLGNACSLLGDLAAARAALERALVLRPAELAAASTLAGIYARTGEPRKAARMQNRVKAFRERNPYYHFALAKTDFAASRFAAAEARLRKAISLKPNEPEFFRLRIAVALRLGRAKDAQRWQARLDAF
jgi:tetratricopeptide (TPR) repeat protein